MPRDAAVAAAWRAVWGRPPRFSRRAATELANAARILDRCAPWMGLEHGDAATWLFVCDLLDYADAHERGESWATTPPASIGFFIRRLRRAARQERRGWRTRRRYAAATSCSTGSGR
ncbi:MAG TPA: hypothetical protein VFR97_05045 [Capillimicrobium sp.]|nr:hypothetical protein [Capillimicrobium sp.]